jgi:hypothetical protein
VIEYGSQSYGRGYYNWRWTWFEHQNFRDERAEAFSALLWEGVYRYTYVTRATTPGTIRRAARQSGRNVSSLKLSDAREQILSELNKKIIKAGALDINARAGFF